MTRRSIVCTAIAFILAAAFGINFRSFLFQENLHSVIADDVYRSAQPSPEMLEYWIETIGLRSLINLKGGNLVDRELSASTRTAIAAGLDVQYVRLSARRWPSPAEVERLIASLDTAPRPVLIHCHGGTDRSGLAAAIALLLAGQSLDRASEQFSLEFGYPGALLGSDLPGFLTSYREWLENSGQSHTPGRFRSWVKTDYVAYYYEADLEFSPLPATLRAGEPFALTVRITNRSSQPIPMSCTAGGGVRLSLRLRSLEPDAGSLNERRFCNRTEALAPQATILVQTSKYELESPGSYEFTADLVDENREHFFADMGSRITRQIVAIQ